MKNLLRKYKKGQSMPLNIIIILIILLIAMIVVIAIFVGRIQKQGDIIENDCASKGGECMTKENCRSKNGITNPLGNCPDDKPVCCIYDRNKETD